MPYTGYVQNVDTPEDIFVPEHNTHEEPFWVSMVGRTYPDPRYHHLRPKSPVGCIEYIKSGTGVINTNGKTFTVHSGDTYLLLQGQDQNYYSNFSEPMDKIWFNFEGTLATELIKTYKVGNYFVFRGLDSSHLISQMQNLVHTISDPHILKHETASCFLKLIQLMSDNRPAYYDFNTQSLAENMRNYIDLHLSDDVTVKFLATFFNRTPEHIIRVFKESYGVTPHQYCIQCRIKLAAIVLSSVHQSIQATSDMVGFSNVKRFVNYFKRIYGLTPKEYHDKKWEAIMSPPPPKIYGLNE